MLLTDKRCQQLLAIVLKEILIQSWNMSSVIGLSSTVFSFFIAARRWKQLLRERNSRKRADRVCYRAHVRNHKWLSVVRSECVTMTTDDEMSTKYRLKWIRALPIAHEICTCFHSHLIKGNWLFAHDLFTSFSPWSHRILFAFPRFEMLLSSLKSN